MVKLINKIIDVEKARLDVTQQALRWIEHNPPPPYYWKDFEAENTLVDLISELALGTYENDTRHEEVQKGMLYLQGKIMAKLCERFKGKKANELDPAKYERALNICRFARLADRTIIGEHANDKVSMALSEANTVYTDQSQQTGADLSCQLPLNNGTTSVPMTMTVSTNEGTNESAYGEQVAADVKNEPVSESDAPAPDTLDESASDPDTCTRGFILRNSLVERRLPGMSMETVVNWMAKSFNKYCDYHNDRVRMHIISTILSKDGDSFVSKVEELGSNVSVKNVEVMELILQSYSSETVKRLWDSKRRQTSKGPGSYDLEQFLNIVLSLSVHVGDKTQEFIDRLLKLQKIELLPLIDAVIAETDGKPVPLLESFLRWNKNNIAQRLLDFDACGEMSALSLVEAALDLGHWNILGGIRSLLIEAEFNGKPDHFFRQLRKWQRNRSFQYLHRLDQVTSDKSPEFLDLALKMCETGLMRHISENRELIGDRPCGFFDDMFGVARMIVNVEAIVVARGENGSFTRDLTPNLRPRLLSTSLSYKLQGLPAWMDSICGTRDGTDPSQLEFEEVGCSEVSKFVNFSLKLYGWGVHRWALNNEAFIGTDLALFFNQLFHVAAVLENGSTSPVVLEAIEATKKIMSGTPAAIGTKEIDTSASSNKSSAMVSSSSDMVSQSLQPSPNPASTVDWQRSLSGSKLAAPPKTASTYKWESNYADPKSSASSSEPSGSSDRKGKKTDTAPSDTAESTGITILARGKCARCSRLGAKIFPRGKILCEECRP
ncbi:uncharacterized protein EAF02_003106 [Botrytis sinoallii]|uniref:uncharacterized protein n=1 Tax=Botrytis sinoallii TaxID=1463999 RepID=UPI00190219D6|nr:uncharacterized protein EAF02_003106 [Botrytis sinoallii]KAF7888565.1 hypothetical protein EAF02_003106 [Botrytis sinoallii]